MKNKESKEFSVVIATYNRAETLAKALDSLLAQTYTNWEAWIVDDGSTDHTKEVVESYVNLGLPIYYIQQENQGVAAARNAALPYVQGKYITFLDSDDWYEPNHLESRASLLAENPKIDLLHGGFNIIGDAYVPDKNDVSKRIHLSECFVGATMFVRTEVIRNLSGFKLLPLAADAEFYERVQSKSLRVMETSYPTYNYDRTGEHSITHSFRI